MRKPTEKRLVDKMIAAYVDWRDACRRERDAYRSSLGATGIDAAVAFMRYERGIVADVLIGTSARGEPARRRLRELARR